MLAQAAAQEAKTAVQALSAMPSETRARLRDAALHALAQAAARDVKTAAQALVTTPPHVVARLSDAALVALARAAARNPWHAARTLADITTTMPTVDPAGREDAARLLAALIAIPDGVALDDLLTWAQEAPLEALAHGRVIAALLDRATNADAEAPMRAILERRLPPPDNLPPPVFARRGRG
ncbi:hypothetical protein [Roseiflexus castenholzii]